jgi:spore coat protein U-like protein
MAYLANRHSDEPPDAYRLQGRVLLKALRFLGSAEGPPDDQFRHQALQVLLRRGKLLKSKARPGRGFTQVPKAGGSFHYFGIWGRVSAKEGFVWHALVANISSSGTPMNSNAMKVAIATAVMLFGCDAYAGTDTANFKVKMTITSTCTISTTAPTNVDFATVASTAVNTAAAGSLAVNCTPNQSYQIALDNGLNFASSQRRMVNGLNYVPYGLFSDSAHSTAWGTGSSALSGTGTGLEVVLPVYGLVPSANFPSGAYEDTVTATITY